MLARFRSFVLNNKFADLNIRLGLVVIVTLYVLVIATGSVGAIVDSQIVGSDAYARGNYVEIG